MRESARRTGGDIALSPWDGARDADIGNDGAVAAEDGAFPMASWLTTSTGACAIPVLPDPNGRGWVDHLDERPFENEEGLPDELSDVRRAATPKNR